MGTGSTLDWVSAVSFGNPNYPIRPLKAVSDLSDRVNQTPMQKNKLLTYMLTGVLALWFAAANAVFGQGITSAALNGIVSTKDGKPVAGATVTVLHEPSGTRATTTTRANGQYNFSNLRIGGPYTVSASATSFQADVSREIYLDQGDSAAVNFSLGTDIVQLEEFSVVGTRDGTFGTGKMGTGSYFNEEEISNVTSVRRNIQDIAQMDSRLFLGSLDQGGQLSAQGQNFRFNSLLVDGVQATDTFGLNSNGFSSQRSPIPLEAIQSFSVSLNDYDVRKAGYTGALLNAVIKSGTNVYQGSVWYEFSNEGLRQKNPLNGIKEAFDERTMGLTIGGPIIKNKLFFFYAYDDFKRETASPQAIFVPDANGKAQIATIIARAKALGYDPGTESADTNLALQKTHIGKLDWNISERHRATLTYRRNYGEDTSYFNYTSSTGSSLSSVWYQQPRNTDSYNAQLFSQWTPDFRTEATYSYTEYDGSPAPLGKAFPQVSVQGITGTRLDTGATITNGNITFGTDSSRHLNFINTEETQMKLSAEYSRGDHTIALGGENVATKYKNAFVQATYGVYTFANVGTWVAGTPPTSYTLQRPFPGFTIDDAVARWEYDAYAFFVQDTWKPSAQLTVTGGLRYDYPSVPDAPPVAAGFSTAGFTTQSGKAVTRNDTTNDGNATLAPRIGFTYEFNTERKTQLRGGVGLFQGKNPAVWISNAYSNAGATANVNATSAQLPGLVFSADPNNQPVPAGTLPTPNINITDPDFVQPALWKSNIAIDHKLPFGSMTFTAEYYYNRVDKGINVEFLNYLVATSGPTTLPDGRTRYAGTISATTTTSTAGRRRNTSFADVFYLTNTDKGKSDGATISLYRPMKDRWSWSLSYTHADATEVSPITSSTASSNYSNRAVFNPNEDVASTSNTNITDRMVLALAREFEFVKNFKTTAALVYQGRTGHPYSWVFYGDANGDGYAFNDLLYVPRDASDPKVAWADTAQRDAFFAFVKSSSLVKYAGTNAPRNSETSPWTQQLDLKLTQQIPLYRTVKAELYVNLLNFWNLVDDQFGALEEVPFSYRRAVAGATYNAAGNGGLGQWNYTFTGTTLNGVPVTVNDTPVSRWQAQVGIRVRF